MTTSDNAVAAGTKVPVALTDGFVNAFWAGAAIAFVGLLVSIFVVRSRDLKPQETPSDLPIGGPALEEAA